MTFNYENFIPPNDKYSEHFLTEEAYAKLKQEIKEYVEFNKDKLEEDFRNLNMNIESLGISVSYKSEKE